MLWLRVVVLVVVVVVFLLLSVMAHYHFVIHDSSTLQYVAAIGKLLNWKHKTVGAGKSAASPQRRRSSGLRTLFFSEGLRFSN